MLNKSLNVEYLHKTCKKHNRYFKTLIKEFIMVGTDANYFNVVMLSEMDSVARNLVDLHVFNY